MRPCNIPCVVAVLISLTLTSCTASTQGPTTWIDRPLNGAHVPLVPLTIQAHASDADGVVAFRFFTFDTLVAEVPIAGPRLGDASIEWVPPGPGIYTISAEAIDSQGNIGPNAVSQITVGDLVGPTVTTGPASTADLVTDTPTPTVAEPITDTPSPAPSSTDPSFTLTQNANCRAGPGTAYEAVDTLYEGDEVSIEGRNEESNWFWVNKPGGSGHCWVSLATGQVTGDLATVPVVSAPPLPATAISIPPDLTSPVISDLSADPTIISVQAPCGDTRATTIIRARVVDPSGITRVVARVLGVGEFEMTLTDSDTYQAALGPFAEAGTLSIIVQAQDNAGNTASGEPLTVQVVACPG